MDKEEAERLIRAIQKASVDWIQVQEITFDPVALIFICQIKSYTENKVLHQKRWRSLIILNGRQLVIDTEVVGSHNKVAN
jgi:hypothetical protein